MPKEHNQPVATLSPSAKKEWVLAASSGLLRARRLMETLRAPGGCPWDNKQTHSSLARYLQEECYELLDLLRTDSREDGLLQEELGDVLLQVLFHARLAEQEGRFDIDGVADMLVRKMIDRHPHVFSDAVADTAEAVQQNWERRKQKHKGAHEFAASIPVTLPALHRSHLVNDRAAQMGFDWDHVQDVFAKLHEEEAELQEAIARGDRAEIEHEIGDLLTVVVNLARFTGVDAEAALQTGTDRFIKRFRHVLTLVKPDTADRRTVPEIWDQAWEEAKRDEGHG